MKRAKILLLLCVIIIVTCFSIACAKPKITLLDKLEYDSGKIYWFKYKVNDLASDVSIILSSCDKSTNERVLPFELVDFYSDIKTNNNGSDDILLKGTFIYFKIEITDINLQYKHKITISYNNLKEIVNNAYKTYTVEYWLN